ETDKLQLITQELAEVIASQQQAPELLAQQLAQDRETLLSELCDRTQLAPQQAESVLDSLQSSSVPAPQASPRTGLKERPETTSNINVINTSAPSTPKWRQLIRLGLSQVDLSDWDIERAWNTFQSLKTTQDAMPFNIVSLDVEDYLSQLPRWALEPEALEALVEKELTERLYDTEAAPEQVEKLLKLITPEDFSHWLMQRGDLPDEAVDFLTQKLSSVHSGVLKAVQEKTDAIPRKANDSQDDDSQETVSFQTETDLSDTAKDALTGIQDKLLSYFRYTNLDKLTAESVAEKLDAQLEESELLTEEGLGQLHTISRSPLQEQAFDEIEEVLSRRNGITAVQQTELISALKAAWKSHLPFSVAEQTEPSQAVAKATELTLEPLEPSADDESFYSALSEYFSSISWPENWPKSLSESLPDLPSPELPFPDLPSSDLQADIVQHFKHALKSVSSIPAQLDEARLLSALSLPAAVSTDVSSELYADLTDWADQHRREWLKSPRRWAQRAASTSQDWGEQLTAQLSYYLQHQKKSNLHPAQVLQDVSHIVKATARSLPNPITELPSLDADFWQQALDHRSDLSVADKQDIIDGLTTAWQTVSHSIKQWGSELQSASQALSQIVGDEVEGVRDQFVEAVEIAQQKVQNQSELIKYELQQQAEAVRHQAAIAAWWLLISLLTSEVAAAGGGWLAAGHPLG
ncbi:MAG: hypothetical protein WBD47_05230, partial [Phormidesmis sp.]